VLAKLRSKDKAAGWAGGKINDFGVSQVKADEVVSLALVKSSRSLEAGHFDALILQEDPNVHKQSNYKFVQPEAAISFIDDELKQTKQTCR